MEPGLLIEVNGCVEACQSFQNFSRLCLLQDTCKPRGYSKSSGSDGNSGTKKQKRGHLPRLKK
jgi:hypothetical protein